MRICTFVLTYLCFSLALPTFAHDGAHSTIAVKAADTYRPTAMPDRIVLTWTGSPCTTQAVTWRTSTDVKIGLGEITEADAGPNFPAKAIRSEAQTQVLVTDINEAHFHTIQWRGLGTVAK